MLPSRPLSASRSVSTALICPPIGYVGCHPYTTQTHTHTQPPTLVFRHVGCSTSRDQRPVGSSPAHSPVSLLRCRAVRAFCSPSSTPPISSHATQPLLPVSQGTRGSTGAVQQATCVRLWGRPGHAPSSPLREEALPRMFARMGRCERVRM